MYRLLPIAILLLGITPSYAADAPAANANPGQSFLHAFDADGSGNVSKDEYVKPHIQQLTQQLEQQFEYMDKNHDGQVDAAEADAFAQEMQRYQQQQQQQQPPQHQ